MLVLDRKNGQQIKVGEDIVITILRSKNGHTQVGIEAPPELKVLRGELEVREVGGAK